ncbi:MAG: hypothetical protein GF364_11745, partial [Candidatus Lokiarchaeota archaeon]|nr:hypothetical protein [Candidatus Lokiarchaeota archaeon]
NDAHGLEFVVSPTATIDNNTFANNAGLGVTIGVGNDYTNITHNLVYNNEAAGINADSLSFGNITHNTVYNNSHEGLTLLGVTSFLNISCNNFLENNNYWGQVPVGGTMIFEESSNYHFDKNFWSDHSEPDENEDGIVDNPKNLPAGYQDPNPKNQPYNHGLMHILTRPFINNLSFFYSDEILRGIMSVEWNKSKDTWGNDVTHKVYFSNNSGSDWYELSDYTSENIYYWDTTKNDDGLHYRVKIISNSSAGLISQFHWKNDTCIHNYLPVPQFINCAGGEVLWGTILVDWEDVTDSIIEALDLDITYCITMRNNEDDPPSYVGSYWSLEISEYSWNTENVLNSSKILINITASSSDGLISSSVSDYMSVINVVSEPTITSLFRNDYTTEDTAEIDWLDSVDVQNRIITYDLYYSSNRGLTWVLIEHDLTDSEYDWPLDQLTEMETNLEIKVCTMIDGVEVCNYRSNEFSVEHYYEDDGPEFIIVIILIISSVVAGGIVFLFFYKRRIEETAEITKKERLNKKKNTKR